MLLPRGGEPDLREKPTEEEKEPQSSKLVYSTEKREGVREERRKTNREKEREGEKNKSSEGQRRGGVWGNTIKTN